MSWTGVITNAGKAVLAGWVEGSTLTLTSAYSGAGYVAEASMMAQTALVEQKQSMSFVSIKTLTDGRKVKLQLSAPATAYTLNQIGIWGKVGSGTPALLALYQNETGVNIPSSSTSPDFVYSFFATLNISNTGSLSVTIDPLAYVSETTLEEAVDGIHEELYHRNLLDNGWFTVNQRGVSGTWTPNTYGVDRWLAPSGNAIISNTNNIITINTTGGTSGISQRIEDSLANELLGKVVTLSIKYSDNTIASTTVTLPSTFTGVWKSKNIDSSAVFAYVMRTQQDGCTTFIIASAAGTSISVKAVKLELGSVSTLANDIIPDYAGELRRCQRYFLRLKAPNASTDTYVCYASCQAQSASTVWGAISLPVPMRSTGVGFSNLAHFVVRDRTNGVSIQPTLIGGQYGLFSDSAATHRCIYIQTGSVLTPGNMYGLYAINANAYIEFNGEL